MNGKIQKFKIHYLYNKYFNNNQTGIKQIIGQQGPQSNMNKLKTWLQNWHRHNTDPVGKLKPKPKANMWGQGDPQGVSMKAALLSGPPGLGKTTTATLVCQVVKI